MPAFFPKAKIVTAPGPSKAAWAANNTDFGDDDPALQPVPGAQAHQVPIFRLTFRDPEGEVQHATVTGTWRPYIGHTRAEERKSRIRRAYADLYKALGCTLLTIELCSTYPMAL